MTSSAGHGRLALRSEGPLGPLASSLEMEDPVSEATTTSPTRRSAAHFDVIVIGAGFGGLYALHKLREIGLTARVLEMGEALAARGTGTAIRARASTSKASSTPTASPRKSSTSGTGAR